MSLSPEQRAIRATGIGGSEIAGVAGLSPWVRPIDIWQRKLGIAEDRGNFNTERGDFMEPALIAWYAKRTGRNVVRATQTFRHPKYKHVLATPDALIQASPGAPVERTLEVKSPNWRTAKDWGESGTDAVPEYYVPQLIFEAACTGAANADGAAEINGDLRIYTVPFNAQLFEVLADIAERFWVDHVIKRVPPPPDFSESYSKYLAREFPESRGYMRPAGASEEVLAEQLRAARAARIAAERAEAKIENDIKAVIGEADGIEGPWGRITWRKAGDSTVTDWKGLVAELRPPADLIARFSSTKPGSRRFLTPRSWDKEE
jgi:putative phage-type endonuclease